MFTNRELEYMLDSLKLEQASLELEGEENCRRYKILARLSDKVLNRMTEEPQLEENLCFHCFAELMKTDPGPGLEVTGYICSPKVAADS